MSPTVGLMKWVEDTKPLEEIMITCNADVEFKNSGKPTSYLSLKCMFKHVSNHNRTYEQACTHV